MMHRNRIPKHHTWCSYCIEGNGVLCEHHRAPDDSHCEFTGPYAYEPSAWVLSVVGKHYRAWDDKTYLCIGYDPRHGFWMQDINSPKKTNISERAIDRTFHRTYDD